jgi:oligosaccharide repeat unit polymerase
MDQNWEPHGVRELTGVTSAIEKTSANGSVLLQLMGVTTVVIICLAWIAVNPSPGIVLLLGLTAMTYVNYVSGGRDVLYPAFTYTSIWALVAFGYALCPIEVDKLGSKTVAIFLAGGAVFSIGSFLGNRPLVPTKHIEHGEIRTPQNRDNSQARNLLLCCTILVTILFLMMIIRLAGGISGLNLSFLIWLNSPWGPLEQLDPFSNLIVGSGGFLAVLTLWVLLMEEKSRWKIALCIFCVCLFPLFVTQRGLVMVTFCGCISLFLLKRRDRSFRKMAAPLSIAALTIVSLMSLMSLTKYWVQSGQFSATNGAWMYITGPLAAFNYAQVLTPLSQLQLIHYRTSMEVDGSALDRFVQVPFPANVYTAYKPYYEDFGALGCFAAFTLFGFIEGIVFYSAIRGRPLAILFLVHLSSSLMFATFDDLYHGFSRHLNVIVFAVGYFWILKRVRLRL